MKAGMGLDRPIFRPTFLRIRFYHLTNSDHIQYGTHVTMSVRLAPALGAPHPDAYTLWRKTTKFCVVTDVRGVFQEVRHAPLYVVPRGFKVYQQQLSVLTKIFHN